MTASIYFERTPSGVRMVTTANTDRLVQRMSREHRRGTVGILGAIEVADLASARKVRRVVSRAWARQRQGGGFAVTDPEVVTLLHHFASQYRLPCLGAGLHPSPGARRTALQHFAKGRGAKWRGKPDSQEFASARVVLNEMLAAGVITMHKRRKAGEIEYRGTSRSAALARAEAMAAVPDRADAAPAALPPAAVMDFLVVPDPYTTREQLLYELEQRDRVGGDPRAVQPGYRVAAVNLRLLIGTMANVAGLTEAQRLGAQHFRTVADHALLGGAKAIDYEATRVDTSLVKDAVIDAGVAARAEFHSARKALGLGTHRLAVAERMIIAEESVRQVSEALGYGQGGAARKRIIELAKDAATVLADEFGFLPKFRGKPRFEGDRPEVVPEGFRSEVPARAGEAED